MCIRDRYNIDVIEPGKIDFRPGAGLGIDIRTYGNRYLYINNTIGIGGTVTNRKERSKDFYPLTGLALGYTFGGENTVHRWLKDDLVPSGGLSALNVIVGIFTAVIIPVGVIFSGLRVPMMGL
jgi:hypothetical protein